MKAAEPVTQTNVVDINGWMPDDNSWRDTIRDQIAKDLHAGKLAKLTYAIGRDYKLRSDKHIQIVQKQLVEQGHLTKQGKLFKSAYQIKQAA